MSFFFPFDALASQKAIFRMTLYKIINVSTIQEHPYQTRYGGAEQRKM